MRPWFSKCNMVIKDYKLHGFYVSLHNNDECFRSFEPCFRHYRNQFTITIDIVLCMTNFLFSNCKNQLRLLLDKIEESEIRYLSGFPSQEYTKQ